MRVARPLAANLNVDGNRSSHMPAGDAMVAGGRRTARAGADDQGDAAGVRMPGVTRRGALIATASPAAGSLNATAAVVPACRPGSRRPMAAAALPDSPAGIWGPGGA